MFGKEPQIVLGVGGVLVLVGLLSYLGTGASSITALIPAFFGAALLVLGWLGRTPARRKLCMHLAAGLALLGVLGSLNVLPALGEVVAGGQPAASNASIVARSLMLVVCAGLLAVCIASFVQARRRRESA